jgi:hypothetical protein
MGFALGWGPQGIWLGLTVGLGATAVATLVRFARMVPAAAPLTSRS